MQVSLPACVRARACVALDLCVTRDFEMRTLQDLGLLGVPYR